MLVRLYARGRSIEGCCRLLKAAAKAAVILHSLGLLCCYNAMLQLYTTAIQRAPVYVRVHSASSVLSFHIERVEFNLV